MQSPRVEKTKVDSEYLIMTIKKYECIWNKNSPEYQKKCAKDDAWNEICSELIDRWHEMREETKQSKQWELKKRWNNIRDYYKKDLALQLNGAIGLTKRKRYVFSKTLDFLRPVLDQSITYEKPEEEPEEQEVYLEEHLYSSDDETEPKRKEIIREYVEDKASHDIPSRPYVIPSRSENLDNDCDWLFLRSLLSDIKQMNRTQKLEFKMGVLKLYKDIMFEGKEEYCDVDCKNPLK